VYWSFQTAVFFVASGWSAKYATACSRGNVLVSHLSYFTLILCLVEVEECVLVVTLST